ncbi:MULTISPECIES: FtsX-like permease family protein [unclassified Streptomyces]|uniref:FtsX-like permease family protein n=1 Tax=unclassified Streptomyces TaxID=2593676 RepID=UPI002034092E|nr:MULTISPECIES: ABC transporter permease [unclassified Streptomyces]MCM2420496.1 ABC transporter permease [Streptomyces sp. RKAG293]MCM2427286.1 ABC transporter permease [Streptomyces sp. RKAG337]
MNGWLNSWRAAVRIARRDAWRFKGRSILVLAMIALPILGVSAADITIRSSQLTAEQSLTRALGAADAELSDAGYDGLPVYQSPDGKNKSLVNENASGQTIPGGSGPGVDVPAAIPAGAKTLKDSVGTGKVHTKYGLLDVDIRELKASDPMAAGIMELDRGHFPDAPDEVIATNAFLKTSGLHVGSSVSARDLATKYKIVGAYDLPGELKTTQINALPGAFLAPLAKALKAAGRDGPGISSKYLVAVDGGFTWNMVKGINAKSVVAHSRAVSLDPPADSEVPLFVKYPDWNQSYGGSTAEKAALLAVGATIVGLAMLEICLLAGPAFAVGARRSRRQLGLVGANGGDRRHIRAIVLSGGLVIGVVAAFVGTVLGLALTFALREPLEQYTGARFGGISVHPLELLGIGLLAILTGLLAAIVPAVVASRQSVLAALTGRRGVRHANRVLPVLGLAAVCLGVGIAVFGSMKTDNVLAVGGGSAIAELGIVALTPTLVGLFGRLGGWLPLSPRLALRDAVRNRGRTAPAVAAVLAAVAGTVAVATYTASSDLESRNGYEAQAPYGVVAVSIEREQGRDLDAVRAAIEKRFPVSSRADVSRVVVGKKTCSMYRSNPGCGRAEMVLPPANACPTDGPDADRKFSVAERRKLAKDWRCDRRYHSSAISTDSDVLIGDAGLLHALGIKDPGAEQALAAGHTVLFDKHYVEKNRLTFRIVEDSSKPVPEGQDAVGPLKSFPTYVAQDGTESYGVRAIMTPATAKAAGLQTVPFGSYFVNENVPSSKEQQALDDDLAKLGADPSLYVEEGYVSDNNIILLALTVFAGLVTIGAAGIATGLAQADAEPDLKTLAAIGADPRVRRTLSGFQCGVVAVMGVVLGSAAGVLPAIGLRKAEERQQLKFYQEALDRGWGGMGGAPHIPIVIPWSTLAALIVAVPLGAALLAALVTRSRTSLSRREAS